MNRLFTGWNFFRIVRLVIGLAALVQGLLQKEGLVLAVGIWTLFGAVFNLGCCSSGECSVPTLTRKTNEEVVYEEVDVSK